MSSSPSVKQSCEAESDRSCSVVVQNTFVNIVDASSSARPSSLRPTKSDSCLFRQGADWEAEEGAPLKWADQVDDELDRLSEVDTSPSTASRQRSGSSVPSHAGADESSTAEEDSATHVGQSETSDEIASCPTPGLSSSSNFDSLTQENERLAKENAALMEMTRLLQQQSEMSPFPCQLEAQVAALSSYDCQGYACMGEEGYGSMWYVQCPSMMAVHQGWNGNGFAEMEPVYWHEGQPCVVPDQLAEQVVEQDSGLRATGSGSKSRRSSNGVDSKCEGSGKCSDQEARTTVMLRNLPNNYTRSMLIEMLENSGFGTTYDFLYLPIDFRTQAALGYAFVNLLDTDLVERFWTFFDGFSSWALPSKKRCYVSWCEPNQGMEAHIERYRNSPVMHSSVPDEYKPILLANGQRVTFPKPSKTIRAPRVRECHQESR